MIEVKVLKFTCKKCEKEMDFELDTTQLGLYGGDVRELGYAEIITCQHCGQEHEFRADFYAELSLPTSV